MRRFRLREGSRTWRFDIGAIDPPRGVMMVDPPGHDLVADHLHGVDRVASTGLPTSVEAAAATATSL
ncbi:hypothetical protein [Dactylosporangium salmoneum]|uniref:Uncharacterized protein n=1 Tax=Dactylosporangium salmoneum TaxID=53361 RepID=A0ABN3GW47_9ACTN